jgi:putative addiction module component (TIGR02574 family)
MSILPHDEITKLNAPERLALIVDLWDSIADAELSMAAPQRGEFEWRHAEQPA